MQVAASGSSGVSPAPEHLIHTQVFESEGPIEVRTEYDEHGNPIIIKRQKHTTMTVTNEKLVRVSTSRARVTSSVVQHGG